MTRTLETPIRTIDQVRVLAAAYERPEATLLDLLYEFADLPMMAVAELFVLAREGSDALAAA